MPADSQERLINWSYAVCDAALRKHWGADLEKQYGVKIQPRDTFPYSVGY
jgi:NTE family protein